MARMALPAPGNEGGAEQRYVTELPEGSPEAHLQLEERVCKRKRASPQRRASAPRHTGTQAETGRTQRTPPRSTPGGPTARTQYSGTAPGPVRRSPPLSSPYRPSCPAAASGYRRRFRVRPPLLPWCARHPVTMAPPGGGAGTWAGMEMERRPCASRTGSGRGAACGVGCQNGDVRVAGTPQRDRDHASSHGAAALQGHRHKG